MFRLVRAHRSCLLPLLSSRSLPTTCALRFSFSSSVNSGLSAAKHHHEQCVVRKALHQAAVYLPHQGILNNFIHHNPLAQLQNLKFEQAIELVHRLQQYRSPSSRIHHLTNIDPIKRVNQALVQLSSSFLDRGAAKWSSSFRERGFLLYFASLQDLGPAPWRKFARETAHRILESSNISYDPEQLSVQLIRQNLRQFGIPEQEWPHALRANLQQLKGWAGMFHRMEIRPTQSPAKTNVSLIQFAAVQSILVRSSIEQILRKKHKSSIKQFLQRQPAWLNLQEKADRHYSALSFIDQNPSRRQFLQKKTESAVLGIIRTQQEIQQLEQTSTPPAIQFYTCIDDRCCSLRRHLQQNSSVQTYGLAGFFGLPIKFKAADGSQETVLAPQGNNPKICLTQIIEQRKDKSKFKQALIKKRILGRALGLYESLSFSPIGSLFLAAFSPLHVARLAIMGEAPKLYSDLRNKIISFVNDKHKTKIQNPYTAEQAASQLASVFRDIGTHKSFAELVVILGHGSTSANNPFAAAYNCGACGGRDGGPNARLFAKLANSRQIRIELQNKHNIKIPQNTLFIGGTYNTTTDSVQYFDCQFDNEKDRVRFQKARIMVTKACAKNALQRCNKFMLAQKITTDQQALQHVRTRAVDIAEVRPQLNHATNAAVIIGRRSLTSGKFFDRRAFLASYDPQSDDERGTNLQHVLAPALIVCSGINLEYLFSCIQDDNFGAGTKVPLNIVGHIGVLQGTAGDLRPGLPRQMTQMHVPVRALYVVDSPLERVQSVLSRRKQLMRIVSNDWVHLIVRDSKSGKLFRQVNGQYQQVNDQFSEKMPSFTPHRLSALQTTHVQTWIYRLALSLIAGFTAVPAYLYAASAMNPLGLPIALGATTLVLPTMNVARKYLHGESIFNRVMLLIPGLVLAFNMIALAPSLHIAALGWSLFGFCSTFLIGTYHNSPTVRNNATFAFGAYRVSDFAMIAAAAFAHQSMASPVTAGCLILAALLKSSQFPLTMLFVRSMQGPTPTSALGYAGLSAHAGIVLLASTLPLWHEFIWARLTIGAFGLITAVYGSLVSKTRADRKGALANMTAATLGLLYVILASGYTQVALGLSLGHAAFRMIQILRSPSQIADNQLLSSSLGKNPYPKIVPNWLFRLSWKLRRIKSDYNVIDMIHWLSAPFANPKPLSITENKRRLLTLAILVAAGAPFTPFSTQFDEVLTQLLRDHKTIAVLLMASHLVVSVILIRVLFLRVLGKFPSGKAKSKHIGDH